MPEQLVTPVFQFGTSRFLQAHADLFIHEAREAGEAAGPVTVVAISGSAAGRARLQALAHRDGYPVIIRGMEAGKTTEREIRVKSIGRALDAETDWTQLVDLFAGQAEFVISNTTEAGLSMPPDLTVDLFDRSAKPPPGYPAKLLVLLAARHAASANPVVVLPTELLPRNGDVLRDLVMGLARRSRASDSLLGFLTEKCVFANSLVDRIVSSAIEPAGAIAEPYALWAIEEQSGLRLPCRHPALEVVGDLDLTQRLKLHILNLGHTVLAHLWLAGGLKPELTVREILAAPQFRQMLLDIYVSEVIPGFRSNGFERQAFVYMATTLERFDNPFLDHRLADIAAGHATKVHRRIGGFLEWIPARSRDGCPRLSRIIGQV